MPPRAFFLEDRVANAAMNALAKIGCDRFFAEPTTG